MQRVEKYFWKKFGRIILPNRNLWWNQTHAMIPTLDKLEDGRIKIYYSGRDEHNISHIGWSLIDLKDPFKIIDFCEDPVLSPGQIGCFDDNE